MLPKEEYLLDLPLRVETENEIQLMLAHMAKHGGSDLYIYANNPVWMRLYGRMVRISKRKLKINEVRALINILGNSSATSRLGDAEPINSSYEFKEDISVTPEKTIQRRLRFRVNAVSNISLGDAGISITIRKLSTDLVSARELGVEEEIIDLVQRTRQGLCLVAGATGHGKSTLLASLITECLMDEDGNHVLVTVEAPVEYVYDELDMPSSLVCQIEVGSCIKSFGKGAENTLRMAPTMIVVGEIRDMDTAVVGLEASNTGHTLLATLHANTVASMPERFISLFETDSEKHKARFDLINESKILIIQRLVPTLDGKRVAIREYLIFTPEVRDYLLENTNNLTKATREALEKWGKPMRHDIERILNEGMITADEARKLTLEYQ